MISIRFRFLGENKEWYTNQRVTSYELISLQVASIARVTSYKLFLLHELRVTIYCTSYELLFIARVTSYCLFHELRVTVYWISCELLFACELRLNFYMRVVSYFLTMSYNKDQDDEIVHDHKIMITSYSLKPLCDKELGVLWASFSCYQHLERPRQKLMFIIYIKILCTPLNLSFSRTFPYSYT